MLSFLFLSSPLWLSMLAITCRGEGDFKVRLTQALDKTQSILDSLSKEWQINDFPNFLKSCYMHKSSWEVMKWKYMVKALQAEVNQKPEQFVLAFTGSSVSAGHDSYYNQSAPLVTGDIMREAFSPLSVALIARNVALGNNPCMPYDVCVKYFVGLDADVVHWEQNYFCDGSPLMEQFIRQAMTIPTKPIVVFSEANTGHWGTDGCKPKHSVTSAERALLVASPLNLVSELNKDEHHRAWGTVANIGKHYHGAAIQTFTHLKHEDYACQGPYIKEWMAGAASWHPSVIGHRLRASHHAYFWLLVWKDALNELLSHTEGSRLRAPDALLKDVQRHLENNYAPLAAAVNKLPFVDDTRCYTNYEPRAVRDVALSDRVLGGVSADDNVPGWKLTIYEDLVDRNLVLRSKEKGYADFKWLLYSKDENVPLSLSVSTQREGPLFICQTPGIWGSLPKGYTPLWENSVDVYLTKDVSDKASFAFQQDKAEKLKIVHDKLLDICVQLESPTQHKSFAAGEHALTVVLRTGMKVIVAWLLTA